MVYDTCWEVLLQGHKGQTHVCPGRVGAPYNTHSETGREGGRDSKEGRVREARAKRKEREDEEDKEGKDKEWREGGRGTENK